MPMNAPIPSCAAAVMAAVLLCACGEQQATAPAPAAAAPAIGPLTGDPATVRLYEQTCRACHGQPGTGAPLTGDRGAWAPRMAQGMDVLLGHTINGYRGMPPLGACADCGEDEFGALIKYMAGSS